MGSSGKNLGAPLLALLLVGVVGVAVRFAPVVAPAEPSVFQNPTVERSVPGTFSSVLGVPADLLERASTFGIDALLPPLGTTALGDEPSKASSAPSSGIQKLLLPSRPTRILSDYEVFQILHPSYYLEYLSTFEDLMIQDGRLRREEKQLFDSEAKVISFLRDKVFDYAVLKGAMTSEDQQRFELGLELVQKLHRDEADYLRSGAQSSRFRAVAFWEPLLERVERERRARGIVLEFFAPRAQAQGECSQVGADSGKEGSNLAAVCCDCTINGVPVGCLNAVCSGRPAIYDSATGICGCG